MAEPIKSRREYIRDTHNMPGEMCFECWSELLELGKIADVAIIATMDYEHYRPVMKAIELKYDILLEKPVSPSPHECKKIALAAKGQGVNVIVCHVLRYSEMFLKLKNIIDEGKIGEIGTILWLSYSF